MALNPAPSAGPAPITLDAEQVAALLPRIDVAAALRRMFGDLADGQAVQPPQSLTLFPGDAGDVIAYLGVLARERLFGVKLSPYLAAPGGAFVTAWTLLMSMDSGRPVLLCDSQRLTTERTAGTTALAVDLLAPADAGVLCIVGSGPVALAHLQHLLPLRPWREIRVFSRHIAALSAAAAAAWTGADRRVRLQPELQAATAGAEVIALCTSAAAPVLDLATLQRPALITSISSNAVNAHEVAPSALAAMDVYCDYRATTPGTAGEMKLAAREHGWSADAVRGDLPALIRGSATPPRGDRHAFFRSVGLGLEDVAVAGALWRTLQAEAGLAT